MVARDGQAPSDKRLHAADIGRVRMHNDKRRDIV